MKTWKSKTVLDTLISLQLDVKKKVPVFIIIEGKESKVYPIDTIGTNQKSIVIRAFADEAKPFEKIKELNDDSVLLERTIRYNQMKGI